MNTSEYETIAEPFTYLQDVNFVEYSNENENCINDLRTSNYETFPNDNNSMSNFLASFETTENLSPRKADPHNVLETLNLNRLLQAELDRVREGIDAAIQRNISLQARLSQLRQEETAISEKTILTSSASQRTFGPPFFVDTDGNTPPENEDETNEQPLVFKSTRWTQYEKEALRRGIQDHNMKREALKALKEKWSKEEDEILIRAVDLYGEKNWQQVAHCLDNRTGQQCLHRWTKTLNPAIRRGRWKKEDDEALKNAVSIYGPGNWVKIQRYVLGRTDVQCRERWMNVLSPDIKKDPWANEEDEKLMSLVKSIGLGKWSKISSFMDGRTDNQCWRRYKVLKKQASKRTEKTPGATSPGACQPSAEAVQPQDVTSSAEITPLNENTLMDIVDNSELTDVDDIAEAAS